MMALVRENGETAADTLGRAVARTRFREVPETVRARAVDVLVDTIGVMAAGSERAEHRRLQRLLGTADGRATVIGSSHPTGAPIAATLNGTTPTVYQIDEGHRRSRGHPGIHVVPVVLALAEEDDRGTDAFLGALLAGYEVAARVGLSFGGVKPDIHPHGNWGAIGAAAGAASLFAAGEEAVVSTAIDAAAAVALSPDRAATTRGAGVHHLYPALGAHVGMTAAAAAAAGMTAVPGCLEDFMGPRSGAAFDPDALRAGIDTASGRWSSFEILHNYVKFYPACGHTHTVISAVTAARTRVGFSADDVERIDIRAFRAAAALSEIAVDNDLAARYSVPYAVAAALLDEEYGMDSLSDDVLSSPRVHELARRVRIQHDPALDAGYPDTGRPVEVGIALRDGRSVHESGMLSFGDEEQPASREQVHDKARRLLARRFGPDAASAVLSAALALKDGGDVAGLSVALRSAAAQAEREPVSKERTTR